MKSGNPPPLPPPLLWGGGGGDGGIRRCHLKIKSIPLVAVFIIILVLLFKISDPLRAQMTPPYPSMISEGPASGSEGTIFRGSEGTHSAPRKTLPLPASPPQRPQPAATPLQSQTPATPPDQPVPALRPVVQQPPAKASDRMVTLDSNNVDLQTFIKFISELTGRNFMR